MDIQRLDRDPFCLERGMQQVLLGNGDDIPVPVVADTRPPHYFEVTVAFAVVIRIAALEVLDPLASERATLAIRRSATIDGLDVQSRAFAIRLRRIGFLGRDAIAGRRQSIDRLHANDALLYRQCHAIRAQITGLGATSLVGPIAFVGLMVPHTARLLAGPDYRWVLPDSALLGPVVLLVADVVGRLLVRPSEIEAGLVVAVVGAPVLIALVRRSKAVSM